MGRAFYPGIGQAVAERTILRKLDGFGRYLPHTAPVFDRWQTWDEVAERVTLGNVLTGDVDNVKLDADGSTEYQREYECLQGHIADATILMSGRHLQHGDATQPGSGMEKYTNCATAVTSFLSFYLLLNGSGVGRSYDDDLMLVDWDNAPAVRCVLSHTHADFDYSAHESVRDALHKYGTGSGVTWFKVPDTREGWAQALELIETMAFEATHGKELVILDFSAVREKGAPIGGMQGRPSSGPVPTMNAFNKALTIRGGGLPRWKQALYVDHYFAESVLVGGARRSARMATKSWRDESVIEFIRSKRPIEFYGKTPAEIAAIRAESKPESFLWSANMSIMVDADFWDDITKFSNQKSGFWCVNHTVRVFQAATEAAYYDGTGEPGLINSDKLNRNTDGIDKLDGLSMFGSERYKPSKAARLYLSQAFDVAVRSEHWMQVNPCGEKCLAAWGAFCVIGDLALYFADTLDDAVDAARAIVRALIRTNTMPSIYRPEVLRTNRIGVGLTGIHEFAWKAFGFGFRDLIDETKSLAFWMFLGRCKRAIQDEAAAYSAKLGMNIPHTDTTIKPAGTTSKLMGLTEGAHLPAMDRYIRWVQFREDDPLVTKYRDAGYAVRTLRTYHGQVIVGFPTELLISTLGMGDKLVTASQATLAEQYQWLLLLEKYWIRGVNEDGSPLERDTGSQISYTLKYDPNTVSYDDFVRDIIANQPTVKCCAVMPQEDQSSYEYLPEEPVTKAEFEAMAAAIRDVMAEDVAREHVDCPGGICPVDFREG